jgi:hypothetical protein
MRLRGLSTSRLNNGYLIELPPTKNIHAYVKITIIPREDSVYLYASQVASYTLLFSRLTLTFTLMHHHGPHHLHRSPVKRLHHSHQIVVLHHDISAATYDSRPMPAQHSASFGRLGW